MPRYSTQDTDLFDEHTFSKMREWLLNHPCTGCNPNMVANDFCKDCKGITGEDDGDQLLEDIETDYPGGVSGFLGDLETGNGELP